MQWQQCIPLGQHICLSVCYLQVPTVRQWHWMMSQMEQLVCGWIWDSSNARDFSALLLQAQSSQKLQQCGSVALKAFPVWKWLRKHDRMNPSRWKKELVSSQYQMRVHGKVADLIAEAANFKPFALCCKTQGSMLLSLQEVLGTNQNDQCWDSSNTKNLVECTLPRDIKFPAMGWALMDRIMTALICCCPYVSFCHLMNAPNHLS